MAAGRISYARCRRLAQISEDDERLTRPFATPAMLRANELVGSWMTAAWRFGPRRRRGQPRWDVARCGRAQRDAAARLAPRHGARRRRASTARSASWSAIAALAAPARARRRAAVRDRRHRLLRRGGAALRHRLPRQSRAVAGELDPGRCSSCATPTGSASPTRCTAFGGDPRSLPSAPRGVRSPARLPRGPHRAGPGARGAGRTRSVSSARSAGRRARRDVQGSPGHAGTVPMAQRRDALARRPSWMLAVEALGPRRSTGSSPRSGSSSRGRARRTSSRDA